jgi:hypothetical protein
MTTTNDVAQCRGPAALPAIAAPQSRRHPSTVSPPSRSFCCGRHRLTAVALVAVVLVPEGQAGPTSAPPATSKRLVAGLGCRRPSPGPPSAGPSVAKVSFAPPGPPNVAMMLKLLPAVLPLTSPPSRALCSRWRHHITATDAVPLRCQCLPVALLTKLVAQTPPPLS